MLEVVFFNNKKGIYRVVEDKGVIVMEIELIEFDIGKIIEDNMRNVVDG